MSRFVIGTHSSLADGCAKKSDDFRSRLTKYIPAEIVSLYSVAIGGLATFKPEDNIAPKVAIFLIIFFSLVTIVYLYRAAPSGSVRTCHLIVSPVAFIALAYPLASSLLGSYFIGWLSVVIQAIAATLAWLIVPSE